VKSITKCFVSTGVSFVDELAVLLTREETGDKWSPLSRSDVELPHLDRYGHCHALFPRKISLAMSIAALVKGRPP